MKLKVRKFTWNKEERKVLGVPKCTYAVVRGKHGNLIVKGSFTTKKSAMNKAKQLQRYY